MRRIICIEGEEKVPHVIIEKGALGWSDDPIPVCWNFQHNLGPYGTASDIRREEDGSVTAEIELFDGTENQQAAAFLAKKGDLSFSTWCNQVVDRQEDGMKYVTSARIRSVNLVIAGSVGWD